MLLFSVSPELVKHVWKGIWILETLDERDPRSRDVSSSRRRGPPVAIHTIYPLVFGFLGSWFTNLVFLRFLLPSPLNKLPIFPWTRRKEQVTEKTERRLAAIRPPPAVTLKPVAKQRDAKEVVGTRKIERANDESAEAPPRDPLLQAL